ncbi:MAG: YcaO-like family protein [Candidatus Nitrosopolaris sp.]
MHLRSRAKYIESNGDVSPRVISVEETLTQIIPICKKIGVTRISDITYLDHLYIPNYTAVLPGTEDLFWVYSGKGLTKAHAKTSALMESIERYCSLASTYSGNFIQGTYSELSKSYNKVLHPDEVVEPVERKYNDRDSIVDFLMGYDLLTHERVLVPAELVFCSYIAKPPATHMFLYSHTNGLASGNVLEEAICQALSEVIERDAVSIADLCASCIPFTILEKITKSLTEAYKDKVSQFTQDKFVDDPSIFPEVDISEITNEFVPLKLLTKRFTNAGIPLLIKNITQKDIGIPTFVASSIEWVSKDYGYFARGYGTHPDARIALIRAITEVSQTRAVTIQGARDDMKKIQYKENEEIYKRKWEFMPAFSGKNNNKTNFRQIDTYVKKDILEDIELILNNLKQAGVKRAVVVELTNPSIGIPVVRVIVPGLETFEVAKLYVSDQLFMGSRARKHWTSLFS